MKRLSGPTLRVAVAVIAIRLDQFLEQAPDEIERDRIGIMKEQIERISRIIRQLLDYGRPQPTDKQSLRVGLAVQRVGALVEHRLRRKAIALDAEIDEEIRVHASMDQLHQVFLNLLVNAIDACESGGRVEVHCPCQGGPRECVGIAIVDDGMGMTPEEQETAFEPFVTSKPPGEGTGLGLTIAKDIVEGHGGTIEIRSSDAGTTVTTWWPPKPA